MADPGSASSLLENPSAVERNHKRQQWGRREEVMEDRLAPSWLLGQTSVEAPWETEEMAGRASCVCTHHRSLEEEDDEG